MAKLFYLSLVALAISTATSRPHNVKQVSDNDLVDAKNLDLDFDLLDNFRRGTLEQASDNDLIDLKNLDINIDALNSYKRSNVYQTSDNDLVDAKNTKIDVAVLNQDHDKGSAKKQAKKHCFKGKNGKVVQYSDNDLIDLKNLGINIAALNSVHPRDIIQSSDNDLVDAKDAHIDIALLNAFKKRATVDAAMDVLRRADYDVDLLSMSKRAANDMYQYTGRTHTCYCAAKKSCSSPIAPVHSSKPTSAAEHHIKPHSTHILIPTPHHHHSHSVTKPSAPVRTPFHSSSVSSATTSDSTASTLFSNSPSPTKKPSCPYGWTHAGPGEVIQTSDNDLLDLKNLNLNIDILNLGGDKTSKTVPATDKPTCTGKYCCYKTEKSVEKVIQKSDDDVLDLKNLGLGVNLLNGLL